MKTTIIKKTKQGKLIQRIYTKGINIGDYYFELYDKENNFVERIGNRTDLQPYLDSL